MKETANNRLKDYSNGYDYGFSNPHISIKHAKNFAANKCNNLTDWITGFKDGKQATGLAR